jgi:hypothetical protein
MAAPIQQQVITPEELGRVGRALFGDQWQTPLARALDMSERSVRFMLAGDRGIHAGIVADLVKILEARGAELHVVAKELRKALR